MKRILLSMSLALLAVTQLIAEDMKINVIIGGASFSATVEDTETGRAFVSMLPLTLDMNELNGNEKYYYLDSSLPTASFSAIMDGSTIPPWLCLYLIYLSCCSGDKGS